MTDSLLGQDEIENEIPITNSIFDPRKPVFRFLILLGCCFITFGSYFCYDIPGALGAPLLEQYYDINSFEYSLFYAMYSLPNTVLPFFGGYFVDRVLGVK